MQYSCSIAEGLKQSSALLVTIEHGAHTERTVVPAQCSVECVLPYDADAGELFIGAPTWVPAEVIAGSADTRRIGIGVRSVALPAPEPHGAPR